ncbi:E3 binding domain-containing protein, partial [Acidobacteria bacterium AH-259-O06]|nr:E3 binding domain-containing protein [Acidobacteria bacterium AH-259-O06]
MPFEFKLPDIGEGIVEGEIVRWLIKEGEHVEEDQPIVEVMTDKATVEIPSPLKGKITKRIGDEGEVIKVGATMVVIEEEEEGQSGVKLEPEKPRVDKPKTKPQEPRQTEAPVPAGGPVLATPAVRRLAREMGVEL